MKMTFNIPNNCTRCDKPRKYTFINHETGIFVTVCEHEHLEQTRDYKRSKKEEVARKEFERMEMERHRKDTGKDDVYR